jgi:hypothetical protein
MTTITIPNKLIKKGNLVVIPFKKWKEIEICLEDFEMYSSEKLAKEIKKRRTDKTAVSLKELLKKYRV